MKFDVITVGGGVGGAALAWALAREGIRVLVLERESEFRDRVRGEGILPWGVNEARDLGIYEILVNGGARPILKWTSHMWKLRPSPRSGQNHSTRFTLSEHLSPEIARCSVGCG